LIDWRAGKKVKKDRCADGAPVIDEQAGAGDAKQRCCDGEDRPGRRQ
jgi:hypothetical protein